MPRVPLPPRHRPRRRSQSCSLTRRSLLAGVLASGVLIATGAQGKQAVTQNLVDIAGRRVSVRTPVSRILLGDGTLAYALALLRPEDPFSGVVAWGITFVPPILTAITPTGSVFLTSTRYRAFPVKPSILSAGSRRLH